MKQILHCDKGFVECRERESGCWVNVECPDREDTEFLEKELHLPAPFLEALSDIDERPRVDQDGGWTLVILRVPRPADSTLEPYQTVPLGIFAGMDVLVTVCYYKAPMVQDFIAYSRQRELTVTRPADFILRLIFSATYWFLAYLKKMSTAVTGAERDLQQNVKNADLLKLMRLQQSLVFFNTSLRGNEVLIDRLHGVYADDFDHDLLDDLMVEMKQADNTVNVYTEILSGTMDAYGSIISNNVNQVMKRMTSITIILMVPTLVASFYGMNVGGLAWADLSWSFYLVILIALMLTVGTYLWLRHIRWF